MQRLVSREAFVFVLLVAVAAASRLLPHAPNFTAVLAVGLVASAVFSSRVLAVAVPLVAMVISDAVIGGYESGVMLAVYAALLLPLAAGRMIGGSGPARFVRIGLASAACSIAFFVITNGAVWAFGSMYEPSAAGLAASLAAGLPFLKYQLAGDVGYSLVLFGIVAALPRLAGAVRMRRAETALRTA